MRLYRPALLSVLLAMALGSPNPVLQGAAAFDTQWVPGYFGKSDMPDYWEYHIGSRIVAIITPREAQPTGVLFTASTFSSNRLYRVTTIRYDGMDNTGISLWICNEAVSKEHEQSYHDTAGANIAIDGARWISLGLAEVSIGYQPCRSTPATTIRLPSPPTRLKVSLSGGAPDVEIGIERHSKISTQLQSFLHER